MSTQDNAKLLPQLKLGFKRTINQQIFVKTRIFTTKPKFKLLSWTKFQGLNRLFVLAFENNEERTSSKDAFLQMLKMIHKAQVIKDIFF